MSSTVCVPRDTDGSWDDVLLQAGQCVDAPPIESKPSAGVLLFEGQHEAYLDHGAYVTSC